MARRYHLHEPGTPERALQDAVIALYPNRQETFYEAVGRRVGIRADSASGTFYKLLRDGAPIPAAHREAYVALGVPAALIDALEPSRLDGPARTRLRELEDEVSALRVTAHLQHRIVTVLWAQVEALGGELPAGGLPAFEQAELQRMP